jgi:hypothetical protein
MNIADIQIHFMVWVAQNCQYIGNYYADYNGTFYYFDSSIDMKKLYSYYKSACEDV